MGPLSGGHVATQSGLRGHLGTQNRSIFFIFYSFGNRCRRYRNGLQMVQKARKLHFGVILTPFLLALVGSACCFRSFSAHNTHKSGHFGQKKRLSKGPFAAFKCWQRAFLVTKMHFAPSHKNSIYLTPVTQTFFPLPRVGCRSVRIWGGTRIREAGVDVMLVGILGELESKTLPPSLNYPPHAP